MGRDRQSQLVQPQQSSPLREAATTRLIDEIACSRRSSTSRRNISGSLCRKLGTDVLLDQAQTQAVCGLFEKTKVSATRKPIGCKTTLGRFPSIVRRGFRKDRQRVHPVHWDIEVATNAMAWSRMHGWPRKLRVSPCICECRMARKELSAGGSRTTGMGSCRPI